MKKNSKLNNLLKKIVNSSFSDDNLDKLFGNLSEDDAFMSSLTEKNSKNIADLLHKYRPKMFEKIPF